MDSRMRKLVRAVQPMFVRRPFAGSLVLGATMASKNSGVTAAALVFTRFCKAGSYVAVLGRSNGGLQNFTADGGLSLNSTNGISEGIVPTTGTYTFTSSATVGTMVAGVVEITGTGALLGLANANANLSTNPGTLAPAPADKSVGFVFESDNTLLSGVSPNRIVGSIQAGNPTDGQDTIVILAQEIPATPGTVFSYSGASVARGLSRKIV